MAEPTLAEVFGANAQEDSGFIYISKADMADVGLTVDANTTYESYLAASIAIFQKNLTVENQSNNPDQSIYIENGLPSLITKADGNIYRQIVKTITFEKLDEQTQFDPNDY